MKLFTSRRTILAADLLQGMTDIHTHLLPGVDDGMPTETETREALLWLAEAGVKRIYLTPHIMDAMADVSGMIGQQYARLKTYCPEGLEVRLAGEYMLDAGFRDHLAKGLLAMADGHVLVETSYLSSLPGLDALLFEVALAGYVPVIAHPERYLYMNERDYEGMREKGYKLQLNIPSLAGYYGRQVKEVAGQLLQKGSYTYVGSDIHRLTSYRDVLRMIRLNRKQEEQLRILFENNHTLW